MNRTTPNPIFILLALVAILFTGILGILMGWVLPAVQALSPAVSSTGNAGALTPKPTLLSARTLPVPPAQTVLPAAAGQPPSYALEGPASAAPADALRRQGVMIFSMSDGAYYHLFAYHPQYLPLTRLTHGPWDDIHPSVSPDGSRLAYASHQNGYWDLYLLDLATGDQSRITDTPAYDGLPTWSPDGQWLAYESYTTGGIQLFIRQMTDLTLPPVQLTTEPGQNFSPAWSPQGREVAFISTRSGQGDVWLARLDRIDDRFIQISQNGVGPNRVPRWSPDGNILVWASDAPGASSLMTWDKRAPDRTTNLGIGDTPVWSPDGSALLAEIREPNLSSLVVYRTSDSTILYPPYRLPGHLEGIDWRGGSVADLISAFPVPENARQPAAPLYKPVLTIQVGLQKNRIGVVPLKDVIAPAPFLSDAADESFQALRQQVAQLAGWDFLSNLENAYLPITTPSLPDLQENWLYTGRAFSVNLSPMTAGWMALIREEIGGMIYWRMYVRCLVQDASQGRPISQRPWDLNARYRGDPHSYDQGGEYSPISEGYWIDFTELASRYGWERLPALINWRTYYPATFFGTFIYRDGLTWQSAMAQVYPPEAVASPTPWVTLTPTITFTPTLYYQRLITPSITPTVTPSATLHPTLTAVPKSP